MTSFTLLTIFIASIASLTGVSEGFVLKTQVDLPDPKVVELGKLSELRPKLVKAMYEVTFLVDESANLLDSGYLVARSASPTFENKLFSNKQPTLVKVETVTDSLLKNDDEVPIIKGYDPDETKHLVEALDELKKQTDLKVKVDSTQNNMSGQNGWNTPWRPVARSGERTPYYRDHYLPPVPCCSDPPRPQWRI